MNLLRPDELAWLATVQGRCILCGHLDIFHQPDSVEGELQGYVCRVGDCACSEAESPWDKRERFA